VGRGTPPPHASPPFSPSASRLGLRLRRSTLPPNFNYWIRLCWNLECAFLNCTPSGLAPFYRERWKMQVQIICRGGECGALKHLCKNYNKAVSACQTRLKQLNNICYCFMSNCKTSRRKMLWKLSTPLLIFVLRNRSLASSSSSSSSSVCWAVVGRPQLELGYNLIDRISSMWIKNNPVGLTFASSNMVTVSSWQRFIWIWWHGQNVSRRVEAL